MLIVNELKETMYHTAVVLSSIWSFLVVATVGSSLILLLFVIYSN